MVLKVKNFSVSYGKHVVLKPISFEVGEKELFCLLGTNGVGKSTLFKCLLGINTHYEGEIYIDGLNIRKYSTKNLAKKMAYIPQSHYPTFNFQVQDIVMMGTTAQLGRGRTPSQKEEEFSLEVLERLGIAHLAHRGYAQISGGERQLVLIARALAQQTQFLIMDEPTANLDYGNQVRVLETIKELTNQGYTIIQSTHHPEQAFLYANRVMVLQDGKIKAIGKPNEVINETLVRSVYGVQVKIYDLSEGRYRVCVPNEQGKIRKEA